MSDQILSQAMQLHQAGRMAEAEGLYARVLAADAASYPALHLMGLMRYQQQRLSEALGFMERALAARPGAPDTLVNYGIALAGSGRAAEALPVLRQAAAALPASASAHANLGRVLHALGHGEEALAALDRALALAPGDGAVLAVRGLVLNDLRNAPTDHGLKLNDQGRFAEALESFDAALAAAPEDIAARHGRGIALNHLNRHEAALAEFDRVLRQAPDHVPARANRANSYWALDRVDEALADYDAVLAAQPDLAPVLASRAGLHWPRQRNLAAAIADMTRLVELAPEWENAPGHLLHLKLFAGDWAGFDTARAALDAGVRAGKPVVDCFAYLSLSDSPADLLACARLHAARSFPPQPGSAPAPLRRPGRIRIGYLSGEFRGHATGYLTAGLFEAHDRSRFEVIAFDNSHKDQHPIRARLEAGFDRMIDITTLSDAEAAARIQAEDIDILVDLNGYSGAMRPGIFARHPARIQVSYLAFPGTTGAPAMDYILADAIVIPEGEERFFIERVMRLPGSYQINDGKRAVPPPPPPRSSLGLPEQGFVFANFNHSSKLLPGMFALWLRLLAAVPGSVLWLLESHPLFAQNLRAAAARGGIDPARLVFAPPIAMEDHVARLAAADLFLDSLPYGAHTTGSDALWAGLPLLTCRGTAFAGRVGASLLTAVGLPELIADDAAAYEAKALALANDPAQLRAVREKLLAGRFTASLFDTVRTTLALEDCFQEMFDHWQNGQD